MFALGILFLPAKAFKYPPPLKRGIKQGCAAFWEDLDRLQIGLL